MNLKKPYFLVWFKGQEKPPKLRGISKTIRRGIDLFRSWIQYKNKGYFLICIFFWSKLFKKFLTKNNTEIVKKVCDFFNITWSTCKCPTPTHTLASTSCAIEQITVSQLEDHTLPAEILLIISVLWNNGSHKVNKVILGGLHWWYALVLYTGNKYG